MRDRLVELRRQRALVSEHLAWIDREIAAVEAGDHPPDGGPAARPGVPTLTPASASGVTKPPAVPPKTPPDPVRDVENARPPRAIATESILEEYRVPPTAVHSEVRRGCLVYFFAAFVLLALVVAALYFTIGSR